MNRKNEIADGYWWFGNDNITYKERLEDLTVPVLQMCINSCTNMIKLQELWKESLTRDISVRQRDSFDDAFKHRAHELVKQGPVKILTQLTSGSGAKFGLPDFKKPDEPLVRSYAHDSALITHLQKENWELHRRVAMLEQERGPGIKHDPVTVHLDMDWD